MLDITERRQAEEELAKYRKHLEKLVDVRTEELQAANEELQTTNEELHTADEKLRSVLDNSRDVIYRVNVLTGRYEYISPASVKVVGFSPDELMAQNSEIALAMIYPDDLPAMRATLAHLEETNQADLEYRQRTKSGDYRWISNHMRLIRDSAGRPLYRDGNIRDITESKWAEEALRESEEQFRTLADSIPNLAWWANADGYITWYNRRWYEYTGTTPQQMEGWGWQSVHDPKVLPNVLERWKTSITTGEPFDMEFPLRGADGLFRPFLTRVLPLKDSAGKVLRWFGTNTDISVIKQAEDALRESEERLRFALETIHAGAWDLDLVDHTAYRSLEHDRIFGYAEQLPQWTYEQFLDHVLPEDRPAVDAKFRHAMATQGDWGFECRIRRADGEVRWILAAGRHRADASGSVRRMAGIIQDITGRKQAEDALRESEEKYRSLIETASEGIWIGDFEGRTTFVNESAAKMIGYRPEELLGKTAFDFMDEEARAIGRLNLERRQQGHKNSYEVKFIRKDGSTLWAIVGATPLRDKNGNVVASMAMITDITGRKLVEEKTLHQQAVLTSINRIFREALTTDSEEELGRVCLSIAEELTGSKFGFIGEIGPDGLLHDIAISDPGWDLCTMKDKTVRHKPAWSFQGAWACRPRDHR